MAGSVSPRPTRLALVLLAPVAGLLTVVLAWTDDSMVATVTVFRLNRQNRPAGHDDGGALG